MSETTLILKNMRGGCATVDGTVHTLFRFNGASARKVRSLNADDIRAAAIQGLSELSSGRSDCDQSVADSASRD